MLWPKYARHNTKKGVVSMKKILVLFLAIAAVGLFTACAGAEEKVLFDFEKDTQGWEIPEWALEQQDCASKFVEASKDVSRNGQGSLKLVADFPGKIWTAAIVENTDSFDWTPYKAVACDLYIPADAPSGLKARIIVTVGENWKFTEMTRAIPLIPGEWVTISAGLLPGSEDWKKTVVDDDFRKDVRKIAIRVESNKQPVYNGPLYIDNIRVTR